MKLDCTLTQYGELFIVTLPRGYNDSDGSPSPSGVQLVLINPNSISTNVFVMSAGSLLGDYSISARSSSVATLANQHTLPNGDGIYRDGYVVICNRIFHSIYVYAKILSVIC